MKEFILSFDPSEISWAVIVISIVKSSLDTSYQHEL